jgi:hypothetical protein
MRLAKGFNHLKNRRYCRRRRILFQRRLDELFRENGEIGGSTTRIGNGWAIDSSRSLPHLGQLIDDAREIIGQRGGVARGGGDRSFFQQILTDEHIALYPSILDFAASSPVLKTVIDYMGLIPVLSVSKPLGVRLNESDQSFAEPTNGKFRESQFFHRDYHDDPMVYVIVTLRDVTNRSGPFSILPKDTSRQASRAMGYGRRRCGYRITDQQMYAVADRAKLIEFTYPAGSVMFVDSSRCFHYGSRDAEIPRYLMMYAYVSVCRADFGDLLRKESHEPVLGDEARTQRTWYPLRENDSQLRRLVLDRKYVGH